MSGVQAHRSLFRPTGQPLLRAAALPLHRAVADWPDPADQRACTAWLKQVWERPGFAERLGDANPSLSDRITMLLMTGSGDPKLGLKVARSVAGYLLRETGRATPFGSWAGVAAASWGRADAQWSEPSQAVIRVDAAWLAAAVSRLEAVPNLLDRLTVIWNDRCAVRAGRVQLYGPQTLSIRDTAAVAAARASAASPIRFADLVDIVCTAVPGATPERTHAALTKLVLHEFLVTALRPPATHPDPLGHVLATACAAGAEVVRGAADTAAVLMQVAATIQDHNGTHDERGEVRGRLAVYMAAAIPEVEPPLMTDLRVGCSATIPPAVGWEAARAVGALLCLTRQSGAGPEWRSYHRHFVDRYSTGVLVRLHDLLDPDIGLGYPHGYPAPVVVAPDPPDPPQDRDARLLGLALNALEHGVGTVQLLDEDLRSLAPPHLSGADAPRHYPGHAEVAVRVLARDTVALQRGDFRLRVAPARAAGVLTARFASVVHGHDIGSLLSALPADTAGALPVQLSFPARFPRNDNVARVPAFLPHVLSIGEHPAAPAQIGGVLQSVDLAVCATAERLHLVHVPTRRLVEPQVPHALDLNKQADPLIRFCAALPRAFEARLHSFDWGPAAEGLTRLPQVTYRRAVLTPARWRVAACDLPPARAAEGDWFDALGTWRGIWQCPDTVELDDDGMPLLLDLSIPLHAALLRNRLDRHGHAALREAADPELYGWIGGHVHDLAVTLAATRPSAPGPDARRMPVLAPRSSAEFPGHRSSRWLSAVLFARPDRHDEIIAAHLPLLVAELSARLDVPVWFVRYRHAPDGDHLRIRVAVTADTHAHRTAVVAAWAEQLHTARIAASLRLDTYRPEIGRYGIGLQLAAAEAMFVADSAAVSAQLAHARQSGPDALATRSAETTAGMAAIAAAFLGGPEPAAAWLAARPVISAVGTAPRADRATTRRATELAHGVWNDPRYLTQPQSASTALQARDHAIGAYRAALDAADAAGTDRPDTDTILAALLHMHHNRHAGADLDHEAICQRAAAHAARAWITCPNRDRR